MTKNIKFSHKSLAWLVKSQFYSDRLPKLADAVGILLIHNS